MRREATEKLEVATRTAALTSHAENGSSSKIESLTAQKGNLESKLQLARKDAADAKHEAEVLKALNDQLVQNAKLYKQKAEELDRKLG